MEFIASHEMLNRGLTQVNRLASVKMPLLILNNLLLAAENNSLTFSTTDLELGIETTIEAEVVKEGKFTVPSRLFYEFIQASNEPRITGRVTDNASLALTGQQSQVKIRGLDASEFPALPFQDSEPLFQIKAPALKEAIDFVSYAAAIDDTRPALAGFYLRIDSDQFIIVATDSYRLVERKMKTATPAAKPAAVIVPRRTMTELARLIVDQAGDISVIVGENQIQWRWGNTRVVSRLIEGNYPQYQSIIPNEYRTRVTAHVGDFAAALKLSQLFAREAGNIITLHIVPGQGMTVEAAANQRGEATHQFTAIAEGEELKVTFNVKYLLDALATMGADNVFLEFSGADRPVLLRPANTTEALALVMPLKID